MRTRGVRHFIPLTAASCAVAVYLGGMDPAKAQQASPGRGGGMSSALFTALDANKDGALTRDELKATFNRWYTAWDTSKANALTSEHVFVGLSATFPAAPGAAPPQNQTPRPEDVKAMMAALPDAAPVKPKQPRKVLVLARAAGFVHSSITIAGRSFEEFGRKSGAWSSTISFVAS